MIRWPADVTNGVSAATRLFALLGDPVAHSLSPLFQNAALRSEGLDAVYLALRCSRAAAPVLLDSIARSGGGGNVTIPHKQVVLPAIESRSAAVERTGACNTFWLEAGRVCGDNTDVAGFRAAANALIGSVRGARVLLMGAGGAARAAACALIDDGVGRVDVLNRTRGHAAELRARLDPDGRRIRVLNSIDASAGEEFDLVVNATPLGLRDSDPLPLDLARVARASAAIDMVYRPQGTAWAASATHLGIPASDGLEMLLHQGAAAFALWWNRPAPLEAMRNVLTAPPA